MSEIKKNPILEILAKKKAQQNKINNNFNSKENNNIKVNSKGFGSSVMVRKSGRGS